MVFADIKVMKPYPVPIKQILITNSCVNLLLSEQTCHPEIMSSNEDKVLIRMEQQDIPAQLISRVECEIVMSDNTVRRGFTSHVSRNGRYFYLTWYWKRSETESRSESAGKDTVHP
jgi:hypothetical protein